MRIVFIEPKSPNLHIFSRFKLPRLGCVLLATIARDLGHEARVFVEEITPPDWNEVRRADLVGISTITATAPRAYAMADRIRREGVRVVMGGPHVTYLPEEAARHADYVLVGEAERSFVELIEHLEGRREEHLVGSLVRMKGREVVRTPVPPERTDIALNPAPDFSLVPGFHGAGTYFSGRVIPVETSRGCPHDCSFCSVTGIFGRKMRYRPTASVMEELRSLDGRDVHVFFYDDNFAASPRRAKELLGQMADARTRFGWSAQMRADAARDMELLELMKATHCQAVYVGIESASPESLRQACKRQDIEETREMLLRYHAYGINVHGMFVLGFDADTSGSWKDAVDFARSARVSTIQALVLTPLPGSRTYEELDRAGRIMFRDWSLYDSHHVVFSHPTMDPEQLQKAQIAAHRAFYSGRRILGHCLRGDLGNAAIALYARNLQHAWVDRNALYMKALRLLRPSRELKVMLDLRVPAGVE
jgi:anaerobic magnesium-protoporphyrin IX monomethyl ester cyclase